MKELEQEYLAEIVKIWPKSPDMVEYCRKKASAIIKLSTGQFMEFEKPSIDTEFCFGYSDDMDGSDRRGALDMAHHASTSEEYFKNRNLSDLRETIERYEGKSEDCWKPYVTHRYRDHGVNIRITKW